MTGDRRRYGILIGAAAMALVLAGCSDGGSAGGSAGGGASGASGNGQPEALTNCSSMVTDEAAMEVAVSEAGPGDRICLDGDLGQTRLEVRRSGEEGRPITILGGGRATVGQIEVVADHVVIDGVRAEKPESPGVQLMGNGLTLRASSVISPQVGDGDGDGIRFFGNDIKILNNVVRDTRGQDKNHADAIQTFATSDKHTPSQRVTISGNRFEDIDNICIIAEGPESEAGDGTGDGDSNTFVITDNYCENRAGQAFYFDDIGKVTLTGNEIVGKIAKAFSFQNDSVGAKIGGNKIGSGVGYEVGMDDSSESDYEGPEPGGKP